jgi:geranylgeranyl diphosphate synthase, type II
VDALALIERSLTQLVARVEGPGSPPGLLAAVRHALFPGGARIRPRLCLAVARACGDKGTSVALAAAYSIELMHCASLVHDDLPCFDDAAIRRGRPSVHRACGEQLAVLAGDALIVLAFQALARVGETAPQRLPALMMILARASGLPTGIVAGQAWECEPKIVLSDYQRAKTGALFAAATMAGALAADADAAPWRAVGEYIGEAYQVADDIRDVVAEPEEVGKPTHRDEALDRPNAATQLGIGGAVNRLEQLIADAIACIPACAGANELRAHILSETGRLLPRKLARPAA